MKKLFFSVIAFATSLSAVADSGWPAYYDGVMLQSFWWDGYNATKWAELTKQADELSTYFDLIWIPNAGTSSGDKWAIDQYNAGKATTINWSTQMGYMPCFWLDYNTIFGTQTELFNMIDTYKNKGTGFIEDVVINHKNGVTGWCDFADETAVGRVSGNTYTLTWDNVAYSGICSNDEANYRDDSEGKGKVSGNEDTGDGFDGCRDLDHTNAQVQQNIKTYLDFLLNEVGFEGFRYDMVKGYSPSYTGIYNKYAKPRFSVGEYWDNTTATRGWIDGTGKTSAAFDFGLKFIINDVFNNGNYSQLSDKSMAADPSYQRFAVTFVDNHDTGTSTRDDNESEVGDCPLQYNWSAANALILALPGTPCIWYYHYRADKTNIQAMILARKACGLNNQCSIIKQETTSTSKGYRLETQGTKGSVYCQFGDAVNEGTPSGYTQVASGDSYKFYKKLDNEVLPLYSPVAASDQEISVFCESAASEISIWAWNDNGNYTGGDWNTKPQMTKMGKAENGKNIFKWTYDGSLSGQPTGLIFVYADGTQTSDLEYVNHGYYADATLSSTVVTHSEAGYSLYFDPASSGWNDVYCYTWRSQSEESLEPWPGIQLTERTPDGLYKVTIPNNSYDCVIFNNGNGGEGNQTKDLIASADHAYTKSGVTDQTFLALTDATPYTATTSVTYSKASYSRTLSNKWGTICLPFAFSATEDFTVFTLAEASDNSLNFTEETDIVPAGKPVVVRMNGDVASDGKYHLTIRSTNAEAISAAAEKVDVLSAVDDWQMEGAFETTSKVSTAGNYVYFISGGQYWLAEDEVSIPAYRGWFVTSTPRSASLRIAVEETGIQTLFQEPVAPSSTFDIYGRRRQISTPGFYVVDGKPVIIR